MICPRCTGWHKCGGELKVAPDDKLEPEEGILKFRRAYCPRCGDHRIFIKQEDNFTEHRQPGAGAMTCPRCDPYAEGVEAAHNGEAMADCPYSYDSPEGEQWVKGYEEAGGTE